MRQNNKILTESSNNRPVNVTFVTVLDPSTTNGGSVATKEIIKAFCRNQSFRVSLICSKPSGILPTEIQNGVTDIKYLPSIFSPGSLCHHGVEQAVLLHKMLSDIRADRPDLIVSRIAPSLIVPPIIASGFQIPYVPLARGWLGINQEVRQYNFRRMVNLIYQLNFTVGNHTYVPVKGIKDEIQRTNSSIPIEIFPNAVDPDLFTGSSIKSSRDKIDYPICDDEFVIGFVGTFADRHRIRELFLGFKSATKGNSNAKLLIVGGGVEGNQGVEQLQEVALDLDIQEDVIFTGPVTHNEVPNYITACDVMYGVSAPERPTAPIKVFEYLSCERPVITTDQTELSFISDQNSGYILPELTSNAISEAINHYQKMDKTARIEEGKRGREYIKKHHTWDRLPELILENMDEIS
jgi:glycosyltransferase involved in cell wall biosynthesis